jgi:hypothetical protein
MTPACLMCEVEAITGQRQEELRDAARLMNPQTDSNYEPTFEALVYENYTLRMLRGQLRGTNRNTKSC